MNFSLSVHILGGALAGGLIGWLIVRSQDAVVYWAMLP